MMPSDAGSDKTGNNIMKTSIRLTVILICLVVVLCSCSELFPGHPVTPVDNPMLRNVPDVDVPLYTLHLEDGKVVADVDYVVNIDIGNKEEFRILNFADVQLEADDVANQNHEYNFMFSTTSRLVSMAKPDMITLTGDQTGDGDPGALNVICTQMDSFGVPWAPVYGNHDDTPYGTGVPISQQSEIYRSYGNCIYRDGPAGLNRILGNGSDSIGNYVVNLVKVDGEEFHVIRTLIFMNSGSREDYDNPIYEGQTSYGAGSSDACLNRNQIEWYKQMVRSVQPYGKDSTVPSGVIMHIPTFGYVYAASAAFDIPVDIYDWKAWLVFSKMQSYYSSLYSTCWRKGYTDSYGVMHEVMCCPPYDEGMFKAMKEVGTDFIMVGHDHTNSFNIKYDGINFVYGMKTGRGSYTDLWEIGATVITVAKDGSVSFTNILDFSDIGYNPF